MRNKICDQCGDPADDCECQEWMNAPMGKIKESEWISVKDRLPVSAGHYLVVANWMGVIEKAEFDGKSNWHLNYLFIPTHWMLLPEPPEK